MPQQGTQPPTRKPKPSAVIQGFTMAFIVIGLIVSQVVARIWFPSQPGEGFNVRQLLTATAIGAVFGGVGWFIGFLVDKMLKSKR